MGIQLTKDKTMIKRIEIYIEKKYQTCLSKMTVHEACIFIYNTLVIAGFSDEIDQTKLWKKLAENDCSLHIKAGDIIEIFEYPYIEFSLISGTLRIDIEAI